MMNVNLARERSRSTFDPERITNMLDGGAQRTARRRQLEAVIANDPTGIFETFNNAYLHRTDRHVRGLAKHVRMIELCRKLGLGNATNGEIVLDPDFPIMVQSIADDLPTSLHWVSVKIVLLGEMLSLCFPLTIRPVFSLSVARDINLIHSFMCVCSPLLLHF
jgi:hypothetical protein